MMQEYNKKIAVFHNFMDNIGGAEIVTLYLARGLNADIYTTNIDSEKIKKMGFEDILPRIKSIGKIPKIAPIRQQVTLWKFRKLNLGKTYDFYIISGDWAMSGAVNNHPNMWYVHSPLNELWAFKNYVKKNIVGFWKKPIFELWVQFNRKLTILYSKHVDIWVSNSNNTKNRVKKYYNQNAIVIHPPIDTKKYNPDAETKNFWLSVNRLTIAKRIELQINAFSKMPEEKLILIGSYEKGTKQFEDYRKYIESIRPRNVEIINWADSKKLISLYNTCKGFITTAKDEDFGMTPIEAMASGKPVIAPNEGGYRETIINSKTGILIDDITTDKLIDAINQINKELEEKPDKYRCMSRIHSLQYDTFQFIKKIKEVCQI